MMTETTYEAPERIEIESECGHANRYNSEDRKTLLRGPDDAPDYFCGEYVRADLVQAAVAERDALEAKLADYLALAVEGLSYYANHEILFQYDDASFARDTIAELRSDLPVDETRESQKGDSND